MTVYNKVFIFAVLFFALICNKKVYASEAQTPETTITAESTEAENNDANIDDDVNTDVDTDLDAVSPYGEEIADTSTNADAETPHSEETVTSDTVTETETEAETETETETETMIDDSVEGINTDNAADNDTAIIDMSVLTSYLSVLSEYTKQTNILLMVLCVLVCAFGLYGMVVHMTATKGGA